MIGALGDHLWQSTIFAAATALLTLALRRNDARVRYWLWLAASVKFLVPFAVLMALGNTLAGGADVTPPALARALDVVSQPFGNAALLVDGLAPAVADRAGASSPLPILLLAGIWISGSVATLAVWLVRWRRVAAAVRHGSPLETGAVFVSLRRLERAAGVRHHVRLVSSGGALEPGVFGVVRPVLIWPVRIGERLGDTHVEAILAHEIAHVRRHDNLTAALHMVVQAVFWFHPLVWWLSRRLVDERERACDQEVLRLGGEPGVYAEGILRIARCCVESPLFCASGVTGADLTRRIEIIMSQDFGSALTASRKALLAASAIAATAVPLVAGAFGAPQLPAIELVTDATPRFVVTSVKPNRTEDFGSIRLPPGGFASSHVPIRLLIERAYGLESRQLVGGPEWINKDPFEIEAKASGSPTSVEINGMLRALLHDRFRLRAHSETRDLAVLALVRARADGRLGAAIAPLPASACVSAPPQTPGPDALPPCGQGAAGHGRLRGRSVTMAQLAHVLSRAPEIDRMVVDRTGLEGEQVFSIRYNPLAPPAAVLEARGLAPVAPEPNLGDLATEMRERLGLRLEPVRAPIEVLVIDSIDRPEEN